MHVDSLAKIVEKDIREKIVTGQFQPNQKIKEEEIAKELNISRPPIREAFTKLEANGLLVKIPRKGVFVTEPTIKDMWEIYTLKSSLYELSLTLAWEKLTQDKKDELESKAINMEKYATKEPPDLSNYEEEHQKFHRAIIEYSGNRRLLRISQNIHSQVSRYSRQALMYKDHLISSIRYHNEIIEEIKKSNLHNACHLMRQHVLDALHVQYKILDESCETMQHFKWTKYS